jgi:cell wall-associated NlpC family hydrolase
MPAVSDLERAASKVRRAQFCAGQSADISIVHRVVRLAVVIAGPLTLAGCATATSIARPSPFPGAAIPPAATRPAEHGPVAPGTPGADSLVRTALDLQGTRYRSGGDEPTHGFDCSGLVRYVYAQQGVDVPRTVIEQYQAGTAVSPSALQAGDLVFFSTSAPGATHVGIVIGSSAPGAFVHAPADGGVVRIERLDVSYWRNRIVGARRIISASGRE